ncbi:hypothetical protein OG21DRAFT_1490571 [Imleria badia]|nr:hypothetical protein OG21DRAFT_1490571 [Imleria badia]
MSPSKSLELNSVLLPLSSTNLPQAHSGLASHPSETPTLDSPLAPGLPCLTISFVNAAAFKHVCKLEGFQAVQFTLSLSSMSAHSASFSVFPPQDPVDLSGVPPEYHDYADIFKEGTKPPIGRLSSLSPIKQESLWEFLDEHLSYGFICQSSSPHAASVLFIQKKDGSL